VDHNDCQLLQKYHPTIELEVSNDFNSIIQLKKILISQTTTMVPFANAQQSEQLPEEDNIVQELIDEENSQSSFLQHGTLGPITTETAQVDRKSNNSFKRNMNASRGLNMFFYILMSFVYSLTIHLIIHHEYKTRVWFLQSWYFYTIISITAATLIFFIALLCVTKKTYCLKTVFPIISYFAFLGYSITFVSLYSNCIVTLACLLAACFILSFLFSMLAIANSYKHSHSHGTYIFKWITCLISLISLIIFLLLVFKKVGVF